VRYGGFVGDARQGGIVSLSPELFIERQGERLVTRPMKGTAPRSVPQEQLRASAKDRAENLMIVDLLRNDLGRVADNGSVVVDRLFDIEDYPTVWQMVSEISARVGRRGFGDILHALFPCGSITGAPKVRAMQIVGELEGAERACLYGRARLVGAEWRLPAQCGDSHAGTRAGRSRQAGCRQRRRRRFLDAAAEWAECQLKAGFPARLRSRDAANRNPAPRGWRLSEAGRASGTSASIGCLAGFPLDEQAVKASG
jgi:para-aminobenzoate synthetase/4-amino-4-deoxychorismate lyase